MSMFDKVGSSDLVFPPKVGGDEITVTIKDLRRNYDAEEDRCYKSKTKNFGYRDEFKLSDDKMMPCSTWKLFFAIKDSGANIGDTITIGHPAIGQYTVKVAKNTQGKADVKALVGETLEEIGKRNETKEQGWS